MTSRWHDPDVEGPIYRDWDPLLPAARFAVGPVLVVAPHPDDEIIGCGGLLAAHRDAGHPVHVVIMTDGAQGNPGQDGDDRYRTVRRDESRRAGEVLGGFDYRFLDHADGTLRGLASAPELVRTLENRRPATVLLPSPFELHPDHRATALLASRALVDAGFAGEILAYEVGVLMPANLLLDVTWLMDRKKEALACFASQLEHQDLVRKVDHLNATRTVNVGDPAIRYAEGYTRILPADLPAYFAAADVLLRRVDAGVPPIP